MAVPFLFKNIISKTSSSVFGLFEKNSMSMSVYYLQNNINFNIGKKDLSTFTTVRSTCKTNILEQKTRQFLLLNLRQYSKREQNKPERLNYNSDSDSDSDDERKPIRGGKVRGDSEFWRRKMRTIHGVMDVNNDGVISYDDFRLLAENFSSLGHLTKKEQDEFQGIMKKTWEEQWGEPTPYNLITVEQYLTEMHHMLNDKDLSKKVHLFLPYLFKAVDKDNSGFISLAEFKLFFNCLGLTDEDAAVSFAVIDKNGDGKLSIKEFVKLGRDYFFAEDERRVSKMFWGPIVH